MNKAYYWDERVTVTGGGGREREIVKGRDNKALHILN